VNCHQAYSLELYVPAFIDREQIPRCPACGWVLKPDIILFEEALPIKALEEAQALCESADLILIAGTALEVSPANRLPMFAMENGARMIINTLSATPLDMFADVLMPYDVAQTLPAIAKEVL
jgi:NAD-dependent deacetylase